MGGNGDEVNDSGGLGSPVILGVDTHKLFHVCAVISSTGGLLATQKFPTTLRGYGLMLRWARSFGDVERAGVECTGSYGAALTRHLLDQGVQVIEVNTPDKANRRRRGKTDTIDAEAAARAVLGGYAQARAKSGDGFVEVVRMFKLAKDSAVKSRTQAINQLHAVLVNADPRLRETFTGLGTTALVDRCARLQASGGAEILVATKYALRLLARRIQHLQEEIKDLQERITAVITTNRPDLLQVNGLGPDTSATLLITVGDNPSRMQSEASFASLCGVCPVEASSGNTVRRRLSRGGDRRANAALYRVALARMRWDPATQDYVRRRLHEGKTKREAIRCLKRYLARQLYPILVPSSPTVVADQAA